MFETLYNLYYTIFTTFINIFDFLFSPIYDNLDVLLFGPVGDVLFDKLLTVSGLDQFLQLPLITLILGGGLFAVLVYNFIKWLLPLL